MVLLVRCRVVTCCLALFAALLGGSSGLAAERKPNVIFVLADDLPGEGCTEDDVLAATAAFAPAIELIDTRILRPLENTSTVQSAVWASKVPYADGGWVTFTPSPPETASSASRRLFART